MQIFFTTSSSTNYIEDFSFIVFSPEREEGRWQHVAAVMTSSYRDLGLPCQWRGFNWRERSRSNGDCTGFTQVIVIVISFYQIFTVFILRYNQIRPRHVSTRVCSGCIGIIIAVQLDHKIEVLCTILFPKKILCLRRLELNIMLNKLICFCF